jgi:predicted phage terminase large subunit-like protein
MQKNDYQLLSAILRRDFKSFVHKTFLSLNPNQMYMSNWHIDMIAEYLRAAELGQVRRLIINMPPRSLKSLCISVAWPAWILAHTPHERIMAASYAMPLSIKHSLDCRNVMQSPWYRALFPGTIISREQNEKHKFMTTEHGFRLATSVGGMATGEGGNFLIVDDPMNPSQAMNHHYRHLVNRWFEHTFSTRLDDKNKGVMVLVMQRLHQHDLSGYLLEKSNVWEHLSLPAIAPENHIYHFGGVQKIMHAGELLHGERDGQKALERLKCDIGIYAFSAQYLQQPVPEQGALIMVEWLKRYTALPQVMRIVQSWDTAIKSANEHDASVCITVGESAGESYVLHVLRFKAEYPDLKKMVLKMAEDYAPDAVLIEDKASGQQLLQDLKRETKLPLIPIQPKGDKISRISAASAMIEAGKLYFPKDASWLAEFERELLSFPHAKHDDQVDALSQYINWIKSKNHQNFVIRSI